MTTKSIDNMVSENQSNKKEKLHYYKRFGLASGILSIATLMYSGIHDVSTKVLKLPNTNPLLNFVKENYAFQNLLQTPAGVNQVNFAIPASITFALCTIAYAYDQGLSNKNKKEKILNIPLGLLTLYTCASITMGFAIHNAYQIAPLLQQ